MLFNQVKGMSVHEAYTKAENKIKKSRQYGKWQSTLLNTEIWNDFTMYKGYI